MRQTTARLRHLAAARRAAAAVEFAITSLAMFIFLLGIINLGALGLDLGALQRGVQGAARQASAAAASSLVAGSSPTCPTPAQIQTMFYGYTSPVLASGSVTAGANSWTSGDTTLPGSYLVLTESYNWKPIGMAALGAGFTISVTGMAFVTGTSSTVHC